MTVPAKRLSRSRAKKRRYQKSMIKDIKLQKCSNCSALILPHRVCPECGFYKGRFVMSFKKEKKK